jgi:hypothetical protein
MAPAGRLRERFYLMDHASVSSACADAIQDIVRWFTADYMSPDGSPWYWIDGLTGKPVGPRNLIPELDDYVPFFWMVGEKDFALHQVEIVKRCFETSPLMYSRPQIRRFKGLGLPGIYRRLIPYTDTQDHVEILYGLMELYELSGEEQCLKLARNLFDSLTRCFDRSGYLLSFRVHPFGPVLPVTEAMSGMYIEIAIDLGRLTGESKYFTYAETWARSWVEDDTFREFGVFPTAIILPPWRRLSLARRYTTRIELAKANTSMASGLFALASSSGGPDWAMDALHRWVDGLRHCFLVEGSALAHTPRLKPEQEFGPVLSTNFAAMDILCDVYHFTKETQYLDLAVQIGHVFLRHQSPATGLFPDELGKKDSYIDANTDLAVTLAKLSELSGDEAFFESGSRALLGLLTHHRCQWGFYRDVHMDTGAVLNSLIETRFVSLMLKPLILYRDGMKIYDEKQSWSKFRDR